MCFWKVRGDLILSQSMILMYLLIRSVETGFFCIFENQCHFIMFQDFVSHNVNYKDMYLLQCDTV